MYQIEIYNRLSNSGVPWSKVSAIGWTKLQVIARVLTVENADEWVEIAKAANTLTLLETVKKSLAKDSPLAIEDQSAKVITTMTFKVHEDQKTTIEAALAKAKEQSGTTVSTAALDFMCMDFLGGNTHVQNLQQMGLEKALADVEVAFPNVNIEVTINDADASKAA